MEGHQTADDSAGRGRGQKQGLFRKPDCVHRGESNVGYEFDFDEKKLKGKNCRCCVWGEKNTNLTAIMGFL